MEVVSYACAIDLVGAAKNLDFLYITSEMSVTNRVGIDVHCLEEDSFVEARNPCDEEDLSCVNTLRR